MWRFADPRRGLKWGLAQRQKGACSNWVARCQPTTSFTCQNIIRAIGVRPCKVKWKYGVSNAIAGSDCYPPTTSFNSSQRLFRELSVL